MVVGTGPLEIVRLIDPRQYLKKNSTTTTTTNHDGHFVHEASPIDSLSVTLFTSA